MGQKGKWTARASSAAVNIAMGGTALAAAVLLLHAVLSGWVFVAPGATSFAPLDPGLTAMVAFKGFAFPLWMALGLVQRAPAWVGGALSEAGMAGPWLAAGCIVLLCAERWGALCERARVALVARGWSSGAPAQKSAWWIKASRQAMALTLCAALISVIALAHPLFDPNPVQLSRQAASQGLAWGPAAQWLAKFGLLP